MWLYILAINFIVNFFIAAIIEIDSHGPATDLVEYNATSGYWTGPIGGNFKMLHHRHSRHYWMTGSVRLGEPIICHENERCTLIATFVHYTGRNSRWIIQHKKQWIREQTFDPWGPLSNTWAPFYRRVVDQWGIERMHFVHSFVGPSKRWVRFNQIFIDLAPQEHIKGFNSTITVCDWCYPLYVTKYNVADGLLSIEQKKLPFEIMPLEINYDNE